MNFTQSDIVKHRDAIDGITLERSLGWLRGASNSVWSEARWRLGHLT